MRGQHGQDFASTHLRWNATSLLVLDSINMVMGCEVGWAQEAVRLANQQELARNRVLLEDSQTHANALVSRIEGLTKDRAELDQELPRTAERIKASETKLTASEERLQSLENRQDHLQTSLKRQHRSIAGLLMAIQRTARNPPPVLITRRRDALAAVRAAKLLGWVLPRMQGRSEVLVRQLKALVAVSEGVQKEHEYLTGETRRLADARKRLAYLMKRKRQSLKLRQLELAQAQRREQEISVKVANLEQLISSLDRTVPGLASGGKIQFNLLPNNGPFVISRALVPTRPFHKTKGMLSLPAAGTIEHEFGAPSKLGTLSEGVVIETRYGGQVTSPCDGLVLFAGSFRSYANVVILKASNRHHIVLAGLSRIDVQPGQFVLKGGPLGAMRDALGRLAGPRLPRLYVEFRENGRPINPSSWWAVDMGAKA